MKAVQSKYGLAGLAALLACGLASGCASFRTPSVPASPPAGSQRAAQAAQTGFHAVYEGELRIWFHSFRAIWYVAVPPGGTNLSVAVLSPSGIKIMQMHGAPSASTCEVALAAADRLKPYGEALWGALWWSLADGGQSLTAEWVRRGNQLLGQTEQGATQIRYKAGVSAEILDEIEVRSAGRRRHTIRLSGLREEEGHAAVERIQIECARPRCRLTLSLKEIRWNDNPGAPHHVPGP